MSGGRGLLERRTELGYQSKSVGAEGVSRRDLNRWRVRWKVRGGRSILCSAMAFSMKVNGAGDR